MLPTPGGGCLDNPKRGEGLFIKVRPPNPTKRTSGIPSGVGSRGSGERAGAGGGWGLARRCPAGRPPRLVQDRGYARHCYIEFVRHFTISFSSRAARSPRNGTLPSLFHPGISSCLERRRSCAENESLLDTICNGIGKNGPPQSCFRGGCLRVTRRMEPADQRRQVSRQPREPYTTAKCLLTRPYSFCEEDYVVTRWVAEFINSLTNLAYGT